MENAMRRLFTQIAILSLLASPALAQTPPGLEPLAEVPPPPPLVEEDGFEPEVTIVQRGSDTVEEFRVRGRLYMMKVTPAHGVPYYLVDQKGDGVMVRQSEATPNLSVPMWVLHSW